MKISDLNKITIKDLKGYDWKSVKDRLLSNPTPMICVLVMAITAAAVHIALRVHKGTAKTKQTEIKELRKRTEALNDLETTQKQYSDFLAKIPEAISEIKLIEMLSEIALARNVQIVSLSPTNKKGSVYINLTSVEIAIASESYANTIRFMHDIENSPYLIRIEKWSGSLIMPTRIQQRFLRRDGQRGAKKTIPNEYVEAKIKIGTVEFKK